MTKVVHQSSIWSQPCWVLECLLSTARAALVNMQCKLILPITLALYLPPNQNSMQRCSVCNLQVCHSATEQRKHLRLSQEPARTACQRSASTPHILSIGLETRSA